MQKSVFVRYGLRGILCHIRHPTGQISRHLGSQKSDFCRVAGRESDDGTIGYSAEIWYAGGLSNRRRHRGGFCVTRGFSMLSGYFPPRLRTTAPGIYSSVVYIGAGMDIFPGGVILEGLAALYPAAGPAPLQL